MPTLTFEQARACVLETVRAPQSPALELVPLEEAAGRILGEVVAADRDYPPLARSIRDGFAVRASDLPGELRVIGEVRAGEWYAGSVGPGEALEIMTGAPAPAGADAVVMIEHVTRSGDSVRVDREARPGQFINPQGVEARAGQTVLEPGVRLDHTHIAQLATVGRTAVWVTRRPRVALLATGDEIVPLETAPEPHQIRNSNVWSLAAQVRRAGGDPAILPVARDEHGHTRELVERGLQCDLLLLSGGVSAGKYDVVEPVLASLGAEFFFDRVLIQPGQPLVFGQALGRFFFGLPGNPASTMVTFELFARAAVERLSGLANPDLALAWAPLTKEFRHKTGLTRFLPAKLEEGRLTPLGWQGSSDVPAMARSNVLLVADPEKESWAEGEWMRFMAK